MHEIDKSKSAKMDILALFRIWKNIMVQRNLEEVIKKSELFPIFWINQKKDETFRRENSSWNPFISRTREFWNFRFKTKSWNFEEGRWRPYSLKGSFLDGLVLNLKSVKIKS